MKKENLNTIKSSGFETPKNYFESFENQFLERLNEEEHLKISKNNGFSVPKEYFNSIESNVLEKLNDKPEKPIIILKSRTTFYYIAGIAASFVLLISLMFNNDKNISINTLDTASIESYLYQEDYSNDDLASLFESEEISETNFIDVTISDDTINQYLESTYIEDLILE